MKKILILMFACACTSVVIGCDRPEQLTYYPQAKVIKLDILGEKWSILDNAQDEIIIKKDKREEQLKDSGYKAEEIKKLLVDLQVKIDDLKKKKKKIEDDKKEINDAKTSGQKKKVFQEIIEPNLQKRIAKLLLDWKVAPNIAAKEKINEEIRKLKNIIERTKLEL